MLRKGAVTNYCLSRKEKQKGIELDALLFGVLKMPGSNDGRSIPRADGYFVVFFFTRIVPGFRQT